MGYIVLINNTQGDLQAVELCRADVLKSNTEFNFLRLIIQEHAPKAVDYRKNIDNDVALIRSGYKTLSPTVQQAINDYSKKSKVLKPL